MSTFDLIDALQSVKSYQFDLLTFSFLDINMCLAAAISNQTTPKLNILGSLKTIPIVKKMMLSAEKGSVLLKSFIRLCFGQ